MGEAVHRAAIDCELPIGAGLRHLLHEAGHLSQRHMRIERPVADQDRLPDLASRRPGVGRQASMDGRDAEDFVARTSEPEDGHPTEAVADGRQATVHRWMRRELPQPGADEPGQNVATGSKLADSGP